jgi:hypothetical protein
MTPGFQECRSLTLTKHLVHPQAQKTILRGLSIPNPNLSGFVFFGNQICNSAYYEYWISIFPVIVELL